jgi:hypothetical protein
MVAAYAWDMLGGGFPFDPIWAELRALGFKQPHPPSVGVSRMEALRSLWTDAGLEEVETREIAAQRTFTDFDDFWTTSTITWSVRPTIASMAASDVEQLKARVRARLPADAHGRITYGARANAIQGRVPKSA